MHIDKAVLHESSRFAFRWSAVTSMAKLHMCLRYVITHHLLQGHAGTPALFVGVCCREHGLCLTAKPCWTYLALAIRLLVLAHVQCA